MARPDIFLLAFMSILTMPRQVLGNLRAPYDRACDNMLGLPPSESIISTRDKAYFETDIPRHLIWVDLCNSRGFASKNLHLWRLWGARLGYTMSQIDNTSQGGLESRLPPGLLGLARREFNQGRCEVAEKVIRWGLLAEEGGLAAATYLKPPYYQGIITDFSTFFDLKNLAVVAHDRPYNTRDNVSGLTASDALVLASPKHPVIIAIVESLAANLASLRRQEPFPGLDYEAGFIFLTRMLTGSFTVLPASMPTDLGMCYDLN